MMTPSLLCSWTRLTAFAGSDFPSSFKGHPVASRRAPLRFPALVFVIEPGSDRVVCVVYLNHEIGDRELQLVVKS
jgi:hypothetical protein